MVILFSVTHHHGSDLFFSQCQSRHFWPSVPHLNSKSAPAGIGTAEPPTPCWRNYLCLTPNLSINKRWRLQSIPEILQLWRKAVYPRFFFFVSFYMLGGMLGLCWYLGFTSGWENKRNVPADCVKGYRLFQGASHTKTDIKFCRYWVPKIKCRNISTFSIFAVPFE